MGDSEFGEALGVNEAELLGEVVGVEVPERRDGLTVGKSDGVCPRTVTDMASSVAKINNTWETISAKRNLIQLGVELTNYKIKLLSEDRER